MRPRRSRRLVPRSCSRQHSLLTDRELCERCVADHPTARIVGQSDNPVGTPAVHVSGSCSQPTESSPFVRKSRALTGMTSLALAADNRARLPRRRVGGADITSGGHRQRPRRRDHQPGGTHHQGLDRTQGVGRDHRVRRADRDARLLPLPAEAHHLRPARRRRRRPAGCRWRAPRLRRPGSDAQRPDAQERPGSRRRSSGVRVQVATSTWSRSPPRRTLRRRRSRRRGRQRSRTILVAAAAHPH